MDESEWRTLGLAAQGVVARIEQERTGRMRMMVLAEIFLRPRTRVVLTVRMGLPAPAEAGRVLMIDMTIPAGQGRDMAVEIFEFRMEPAPAGR